MPHPSRFLLFTLLLATATQASARDLNHQLQDEYANKTRMLRGFYTGDRLRYDASGSLVSGNSSGDWTSEGFVQITEIGVKGDEIRIKARRMSVLSRSNTFSLQAWANATARPGENEAIVVEITADLGTRHPSQSQTDDALTKIFLSAHDNLASLVPDYWKPCVPAGLAGKDKNCQFTPDLLAIPGVGVSAYSPSGSASTDTEQDSLGKQRFTVGKGISPPRVTLHKDPEFNDLARRMKYQGTAVLGLTVDQDGIPTKVHVLNPLGCGLDAQAVRAVEGWRFKPAEKDGQPLPIEIAVEVSFHLY